MTIPWSDILFLVLSFPFSFVRSESFVLRGNSEVGFLLPLRYKLLLCCRVEAFVKGYVKLRTHVSSESA